VPLIQEVVGRVLSLPKAVVCLGCKEYQIIVFLTLNVKVSLLNAQRSKQGKTSNLATESFFLNNSVFKETLQLIVRL
jgi:hypothetical protein